jgi:hypothetical protein
MEQLKSNLNSSNAGGTFYRKAVFFIRISITVIIFAVLLINIDVKKITHTVSQVNAGFYILAVMISFVRLFVSSFVIREILRSVSVNISVRYALMCNYVSYYFSLIGYLVGGAARWFYLSRDNGRRGETFVAIVLERLEMLLVWMIFYLAALLIKKPVLSNASLPFLIAIGAVFILAVIAACAMVFYPLPLVFLEKFLKKWNQNAFIEALCVKINDILRISGNAVIGIKSFFLSLVYIAAYNSVYFAVFLIILRAVNAELSALDSLWIFALVIIAESIPITIFGLGIRESMLVWLLSGYGIGKEDAIIIGLLMFSILILHTIIGGVVSLGMETSSIKRELGARHCRADGDR